MGHHDKLSNAIKQCANEHSAKLPVPHKSVEQGDRGLARQHACRKRQSSQCRCIGLGQLHAQILRGFADGVLETHDLFTRGPKHDDRIGSFFSKLY